MDEAAKRKLLDLLGFAARARMVDTGASRVADSVRKNDMVVKNEKGRRNAGVVIIASDASFNTAKRLKNCCSYYNTDCAQPPVTMEELSKAVGSAADTSAVGLFTGNFPVSVRKLLKEADLIEKDTNHNDSGKEDLDRKVKGDGDTL